MAFRKQFYVVAKDPRTRRESRHPWGFDTAEAAESVAVSYRAAGLAGTVVHRSALCPRSPEGDPGFLGYAGDGVA